MAATEDLSLSAAINYDVTANPNSRAARGVSAVARIGGESAGGFELTLVRGYSPDTDTVQCTITGTVSGICEVTPGADSTKIRVRTRTDAGVLADRPFSLQVWRSALLVPAQNL